MCGWKRQHQERMFYQWNHTHLHVTVGSLKARTSHMKHVDGPELTSRSARIFFTSGVQARTRLMRAWKRRSQKERQRKETVTTTAGLAETPKHEKRRISRRVKCPTRRKEGRRGPSWWHRTTGSHNAFLHPCTAGSNKHNNFPESVSLLKPTQ